MPNRRRWHFEVEELKLDIRFVSETETETESAGTGGESEKGVHVTHASLKRTG
jgi:hypothetical protein